MNAATYALLTPSPPPAATAKHPQDAVAYAAALPAGADRIAALTALDSTELAEADRVMVMRLWHECQNWVTARAVVSVAAVSGPHSREGDSHPVSTPTGNIAEDSLSAEVAAALKLTPFGAKNVIEQARAAVGACAPVTARMLTGEWSHRYLWQGLEVIRGHQPHLSAKAVANAAAGTDCTARAFRNRLRRELCRLDSEAAAERIRARRNERAAHLESEEDLRGRLSIEGPWEAVSWAHRQFRRWAEEERERLRAERAPGEQLPTLTELTADAVTEAARLLSARLANPTADAEPKRGRKWRHAVVVTDLPTALGLANEPGWVPGYGFVPAPIARELLAGASAWRRFLIDTEGDLLDAGAATYRPSDRLREFVTARDRTCTFPGCGRGAYAADLDHRVNFNGRNTTAANLHSVCRTHHRVKTFGGWQVEFNDAGTVWISPTGHRYESWSERPWVSGRGHATGLPNPWLRPPRPLGNIAAGSVSRR